VQDRRDETEGRPASTSIATLLLVASWNRESRTPTPAQGAQRAVFPMRRSQEIE